MSASPNPQSRIPNPGMLAYYLQLGLRSLKRNPVLTALMVVGIALGIAASMTTLTVLHLMGSDPIPWKSDKLHYVQLDNWSGDQSFYDDGRPPDQVTYQDAVALMKAGADFQLRETRDSALTLGREALIRLGDSPEEADELVASVRACDDERLTIDLAEGLMAGSDMMHRNTDGAGAH